MAIIIAGAGHAAGELASALRKEGFSGELTLIGSEPHLPYQRPPLSKALLSGEAVVESLFLRPEPAYQRINVDLLLGRRVVRIDRDGRSVELDDGTMRPYEKLVLATGGEARRLPAAVVGDAAFADNLFYLRTIDDVLRMRPLFERGGRLVIVGAGYVGLEVAAVAIKCGLTVTVLESQPRVLARVTAPAVSAFYEQVHREAGVDLRTGVQLQSFTLHETGTSIAGVSTNQGGFPADLVIVGIGLQPNCELASAAGLECNDGVVVDEHMVTADPNILAIGDCASFPHVGGEGRLRLESVPNALEQARVAAATLAGKRRPYTALPWFWSDQYDLKLQMAGLSRGFDEVVLRGSPQTRSFCAFYLRAGRLIALDAVNRPQDFMMGRRLLTAGAVVDAARLADESVPLKTILETWIARTEKTL
jgi:3-phenylpropionate/trans-cinnamate dioxygenase ferredoxin reductase component